MKVRDRDRKKIYPPQPPVPLAPAGGEATISKEHLRIKMPSAPPLGDFKTRSYLNYVASIPFRYNKATGYYEPAVYYEEVKADKHGYFYAAEPTVLADSQWAEQRINKRRHSMIALYDEGGTHLNFVPFGDRKGVVGAGRTETQSYGMYRTFWIDEWGLQYVRNYSGGRKEYSVFTDTTVSAGHISPSYAVVESGRFFILLKSNVINTFTFQISRDNVSFYDLIDFDIGAGEMKADIFEGNIYYFRIKVKSAGVVTVYAEIQACG